MQKKRKKKVRKRTTMTKNKRDLFLVSKKREGGCVSAHVFLNVIVSVRERDGEQKREAQEVCAVLQLSSYTLDGTMFKVEPKLQDHFFTTVRAKLRMKRGGKNASARRSKRGRESVR